jgi:hypothetical protein
VSLSLSVLRGSMPGTIKQSALGPGAGTAPRVMDVADALASALEEDPREVGSVVTSLATRLISRQWPLGIISSAGPVPSDPQPIHGTCRASPAIGGGSLGVRVALGGGGALVPAVVGDAAHESESVQRSLLSFQTGRPGHVNSTSLAVALSALAGAMSTNPSIYAHLLSVDDSRRSLQLPSPRYTGAPAVAAILGAFEDAESVVRSRLPVASRETPGVRGKRTREIATPPPAVAPETTTTSAAFRAVPTEKKKRKPGVMSSLEQLMSVVEKAAGTTPLAGSPHTAGTLLGLIESVSTSLDPAIAHVEARRRHIVSEWSAVTAMRSLLQRIGYQLERAVELAAVTGEAETMLRTPLSSVLTPDVIDSLRCLVHRAGLDGIAYPPDMLPALRILARALVHHDRRTSMKQQSSASSSASAADSTTTTGSRAEQETDDDDDDSSGLEEDCGTGDVGFRYLPASDRRIARKACVEGWKIANQTFGGSLMKAVPGAATHDHEPLKHLSGALSSVALTLHHEREKKGPSFQAEAGSKAYGLPQIGDRPVIEVVIGSDGVARMWWDSIEGYAVPARVDRPHWGRSWRARGAAVGLKTKSAQPSDVVGETGSGVEKSSNRSPKGAPITSVEGMHAAVELAGVPRRGDMPLPPLSSEVLDAWDDFASTNRVYPREIAKLREPGPRGAGCVRVPRGDMLRACAQPGLGGLARSTSGMEDLSETVPDVVLGREIVCPLCASRPDGSRVYTSESFNDHVKHRHIETIEHGGFAASRPLAVVRSAVAWSWGALETARSRPQDLPVLSASLIAARRAGAAAAAAAVTTGVAQRVPYMRQSWVVPAPAIGAAGAKALAALMGSPQTPSVVAARALVSLRRFASMSKPRGLLRSAIFAEARAAALSSADALESLADSIKRSSRELESVLERVEEVVMSLSEDVADDIHEQQDVQDQAPDTAASAAAASAAVAPPVRGVSVPRAHPGTPGDEIHIARRRSVQSRGAFSAPTEQLEPPASDNRMFLLLRALDLLSPVRRGGGVSGGPGLALVENPTSHPTDVMVCKRAVAGVVGPLRPASLAAPSGPVRFASLLQAVSGVHEGDSAQVGSEGGGAAVSESEQRDKKRLESMVEGTETSNHTFLSRVLRGEHRATQQPAARQSSSSGPAPTPFALWVMRGDAIHGESGDDEDTTVSGWSARVALDEGCAGDVTTPESIEARDRLARETLPPLEQMFESLAQREGGGLSGPWQRREPALSSMVEECGHGREWLEGRASPHSWGLASLPFASSKLCSVSSEVLLFARQAWWQVVQQDRLSDAVAAEEATAKRSKTMEAAHLAPTTAAIVHARREALALPHHPSRGETEANAKRQRVRRTGPTIADALLFLSYDEDWLARERARSIRATKVVSLRQVVQRTGRVPAWEVHRRAALGGSTPRSEPKRTPVSSAARVGSSGVPLRSLWRSLERAMSAAAELDSLEVRAKKLLEEVASLDVLPSEAALFAEMVPAIHSLVQHPEGVRSNRWLRRFLPIIEAFFIANEPPSEIATNVEEQARQNTRQSLHLSASECVARMGLEERVAASTVKSIADDCKAWLEDVQWSPLERRDRSVRAISSFAESCAPLLNGIIRSQPTLLAGPLAPLLRLEECRPLVDFDNKRAFFRRQCMERLRSQGGASRLGLQIKRSSLLDDTWAQVRVLSSERLRGKLSISFVGEFGQDAGGLTREFFSLITRQMFNPMFGYWQRMPEGTFQPNPLSSEANGADHLDFFRFCGRIIGKALVDGHLIDAHFSRSFYKHMLGIPITYHDLEGIDPDFYRSLKQLFDLNVDEAFLGLNFTLDIPGMTGTKSVALVPGGEDVDVTEANKMDYVQLVAQHRMTSSIAFQTAAFLHGFYEVAPRDLVTIFSESELELMICGLPTIDLEDLRMNTTYQGYRSTDQLVKWFWWALGTFDEEDKARFIMFVTGTSRVPLEGFKALQGMHGTQLFTLSRVNGGDERLPASHTCFNNLELPGGYSSRSVLRKRLLLAVREGSEGFGMA